VLLRTRDLAADRLLKLARILQRSGGVPDNVRYLEQFGTPFNIKPLSRMNEGMQMGGWRRWLTYGAHPFVSHRSFASPSRQPSSAIARLKPIGTAAGQRHDVVSDVVQKTAGECLVE